MAFQHKKRFNKPNVKSGGGKFTKLLRITPQQILKLEDADPTGAWLDLDYSTDTPGERVRRLKLTVNIGGKAHRIRMPTGPFTLSSGLSWPGDRKRKADGGDAKKDEGTPSKVQTGNFTAHLKVQRDGNKKNASGARLSTTWDQDDEGKEVQLTIDDAIARRADIIVGEKFPDIDPEQFDLMASKQENLVRKEYEFLQAQCIISTHFVTMMRGRAKAKLRWVQTQGQTIKGNAQITRQLSEDEQNSFFADNAENPEALAAGPQPVMLDEPAIWFDIQFTRASGEPWCKLFDVTNGGGKAGMYPPAFAVDPSSGKMAAVNIRSAKEWLTPDSGAMGEIEFQMTMTDSHGVRLHCQMKELIIRRAARKAAGGQSSIDQGDADLLQDMGGTFEAASANVPEPAYEDPNGGGSPSPSPSPNPNDEADPAADLGDAMAQIAGVVNPIEAQMAAMKASQ